MNLQNPKRAVAAVGLALGMMAAGTSPAQAITINTVTMGNPGNPNDTTGYGGVSYVYNIGTTEVNLFQYTAFLNAVAQTDLYGLYNTSMGSNANIAGISRSGASGSYSYSVMGTGARPVTYVSWFDAARFANWMANGQPVGSQVGTTTENGAYTLMGSTSGVGFVKNAINPNTGTTTTWWIPSENEWYKAAYYDPSPSGPSDDYWLYPTRSDSVPGNTIGAGTNQANHKAGGVYSVTQNSTWYPDQNYLTDGGAYSNSGSYYGTYDQGGNVWEWNDTVVSSSRGLRGDSWSTNGYYLQSSNRFYSAPTDEDLVVGFRVASVPEPSAAAAVLMILGGAALLAKRWRKGTL